MAIQERPVDRAGVDPTKPDPRLVLATARQALEQQRWVESARAFTELLSYPAYTAEARYGLGWIELQQGSADRAAALFRAVTNGDPTHANAWYALGSLTEDRSVDEAIEFYRHAVAANPSHHGATERLRLLDAAAPALAEPSRRSPMVTSISVPTSEGPTTLTDDGQSEHRLRAHNPGELSDLGVVEYLRRDSSQLAKDALARIDALNRTNGFRFTAYLQRIVTRFFWLVGSAAALAYILYHVTPIRIGSSTVHFYSSNTSELIFAAAGIWGAWALWTFVNCVTNAVTIRNARIRWTHGVLNKRTETLDLWTARDVELDRNLVQRLTRDGTLTFKGTTHDRPRRLHKGQYKPLHLTGVAHRGELDDLYALLLDLKFLLRANPVMKGIIQ